MWEHQSRGTHVTHIDTNHIARSFPLPQEIDADATPTVSTETVDLLPRRELVTFHLLPPAEPLNILSLRENRQIAVAFADTTIAVLDGEMPAFLSGQIRVGEAKAYGTLRCLSVNYCPFEAFSTCLRSGVCRLLYLGRMSRWNLLGMERNLEARGM